MKKELSILLTFVLCLLSLSGCKVIKDVKISSDFSPDNELSKAQKIVVADGDGTEKTVLESKEEIDAFADAMNVEGWRLAELPDGLGKMGSFTLWQTETVTALLGQKEAEIEELCTFLIYQDGNYLTIDTGFAGITLTFSAPEETLEYLRSLVQ